MMFLIKTITVIILMIVISYFSDVILTSHGVSQFHEWQNGTKTPYLSGIVSKLVLLLWLIGLFPYNHVSLVNVKDRSHTKKMISTAMGPHLSWVLWTWAAHTFHSG
jgi:hypothetical protein